MDLWNLITKRLITLSVIKLSGFHVFSVFWFLIKCFCCFRCWQVLPSVAVHGQAVSAGARFDHRGRVRGQDDQHRGKTNQTSDLGYGENKLHPYYSRIVFTIVKNRSITWAEDKSQTSDLVNAESKESADYIYM